MRDISPERLTAERLYKALQTGDRAGLTDLLTPTFVGRTTAGLPLGLGGTYVGPEAMISDFWWRLGSHFRVRAEPAAYAPLGDDGLQVSGTYRGTARATGRSLEADFIHVLTFDGERICALTQLTDSAPWHAALEDADFREAGLQDTAPAESWRGHRLPPYPGPSVSDLATIEYRVEDRVAHVTLNRPEQRNAIDLRMGEETLAVARAIAADPGVRAVLIAGNGPVLTVGGDIEYFSSVPPASFGALAGRMTDPFHEAFRILSRVDPPIVTAAHGAVAGGGLGFVYAADIVLAAEGTSFSTAFSGIGLSGDGGGTWHLPRLIGAARARRMYLENLRLDADQAAEWGLIAEVVPAGVLRDRALALALRLAAGPTRAFGYQRRLLRDTWQHSLSDQLRLESEGVVSTGSTSDAGAAVRSFLQKRRPTFEGR